MGATRLRRTPQAAGERWRDMSRIQQVHDQAVGQSETLSFVWLKQSNNSTLLQYIPSLIGSRALAAYGDVDGPSAANNHPWSRKCTARLLRRSDTSSSAHGCAGTRSVRLGGAGNVG